MHRIVIFSGGASAAPAVLTRAVLAAVSARDDMEVSAVCLPKPMTFGRTLCRRLAHRALLGTVSFLAPTMNSAPTIYLPLNVKRLARQYHFKLLIPDMGDINHPRFVTRLRNDINATTALSFYYPHRFSPDLLLAFRHAVNYHNGLLPDYRGILGTSWSIYEGEKDTGFTYHHMNEAFDEGPVLIQGAVPVAPGRKPSDLDYDKALSAARCIPALLNKIAAGDPGTPQRGEGSYYSEKDGIAVWKIPDPSLLTGVELMKRLRAFESLKMKFNGRWHVVTKFRHLPPGAEKSARFAIRASDGVVLEPARFRHHPYGLYRGLSWVRGVIGKLPPAGAG